MEFQLYKDDRKEWRWRLVAANGKTIADSSEGYARIEDAEHGIELVRTVTRSADVPVRRV